MNLAAFQSLRAGLQRNAAPATSQVRKIVESGLREGLLATGVFDDVEVGGSGDDDRLVVALCAFPADVDDLAAAVAVERAWSALAFPYWQAHAFLAEDGHVELQAASLDRPGGRYVTLHLVAQRAGAPAASGETVPAQRGLENAASARSALVPA